MSNNYDFKNKHVLITGVCGQIGQELTKAFLASGAIVCGVDLLPQPEAKFARAVAKYKKNFFYISGDVTRERSIQEIFKQIKKPIDALINCAGMGVYTPFEERTEDELDRVIALNIKATILMSKAAAREMKKRKQGVIINFGSIYGVVQPDYRIYGKSGRNSSEIYGATKAGVIHFTKYLAAYLARYGIRTNAISPGGVFNNQDPFFVKNYEHKTPMARMAQVDDLIGAILFLASEDAKYINGHNLVVDGGFTVW
jgi:NAD(P)-dependent dehydrogenase (short-subunit alcohol dehydrogenase family)